VGNREAEPVLGEGERMNLDSRLRDDVYRVLGQANDQTFPS